MKKTLLALTCLLLVACSLMKSEEDRLYEVEVRAFNIITSQPEDSYKTDVKAAEKLLEEAKKLYATGDSDDRIVAWLLLSSSEASLLEAHDFKAEVENSLSEDEKGLAGIAALELSDLLYSTSKELTLDTAYEAVRKSDVRTLAAAFAEYYKDNGTFPTGISTTPQELCSSKEGNCEGLLDVRIQIVGEYLVYIPQDRTTEVPHSGYTVYQEGNAVVVTSMVDGQTASSADF